MDSGSKDLISNLPDALVCHILSFLTTKNAALTSVLSKRWRYLLAFVANLDLNEFAHDHHNMDEPKRQQMRKSFVDFVDRVLNLQGNSSVNKFSLTCEPTKVGEERVDDWISNVLDRGVVDFNLRVNPIYHYPLPSKVLMSKSLVKLKICRTNEFKFGQVFLPKLKTLYLDHKTAFGSSCAELAKIISCCPVLEKLVMFKVRWFSLESCPVSNPSLKTLIIFSTEGRPTSASFDTPNLVYLAFSGVIAEKYLELNFDSLIKAFLDLHTPYEESDDATFFFMAMCNVETLDLSANTLEVIAFYCKALPVFHKLIHLTINTTREVGWKTLPKLLKNCTNLETLVFDEQRVHWGNVEENGVCKPWEGTREFLSSSKVKILKVMNCGDSWNNINKHTEMIKFFLETMPNLEQATIYYNTPSDKLRNITTELENLEKVASPICKIQVVSSTSRFEAWTYGLDLD